MVINHVSVRPGIGDNFSLKLTQPLKIDHPKKKVVSQLPFFRGELLVSGSLNLFILCFKGCSQCGPYHSPRKICWDALQPMSSYEQDDSICSRMSRTKPSHAIRYILSKEVTTQLDIAHRT